MKSILALLLASSQVSTGFIARRCGATGRSMRNFVRMTAILPDDQRVVITGLGPINGMGNDAVSFFDGLLAGHSSIGSVSRFDTEGFNCQIASQVSDDFKAADYFNSPKTVKSNDRFTHFAVAAARVALEDADLSIDSMDATRMGAIVGSAFGGMETYETQTLKLAKSGPKRVSPFTIPALLGNTAAGVVGIEVGAKGPNFGVTSACATASHAMGEAMAAIRRGDADVMLAGGSDAAVTPTSFAGFCSMKALCSQYNDNPTKGSRPFDADRCGFVMGEGAGVLVLESLTHAVKRGARIYCELAGYGASCDAYHITSPAPGGEGLARAMAQALERGGVSDLSQVGYINAHGTSTAYNDKFETLAIKSIFKEEASNLRVSSTKGATGHTLGAAGGLEAIVCAKAIATGSIPPTINYETPDPECDLDITPNVAVKGLDIKVALSTNLGFGGHNAALCFKALE